MLLYTGVPDSWLSFAYKTGARVFISNRTVEPTIYDGIEVATGFKTNLQVDREFIYKLPHPYNDCYNNLDKEDAYDSELYREMIRANKTYRQLDCFRLCFQKTVTKNCDCYNIFNPPISGLSPCSTTEQLTCSAKEYEKFYSEDITIKCGNLWCVEYL